MNTIPLLKLVATAVSIYCGGVNGKYNPFLVDVQDIPTKNDERAFSLCKKEVKKCGKQFYDDGFETLYGKCLERADIKTSRARIEALYPGE